VSEKSAAVADVSPPRALAWADALDLARLTPDEERRLGRELHELIVAGNPVLDTGPWKQRVVTAARPLLATRDSAERDYQFTVLDSDAVNAFSLPGGYVYVCRGLFDLVGNDEDFALEFVLGHEIAHVELRHALKCVGAGHAAAVKKGIDTLRQFLVPVALGYPDAMEFEADAWAYRRMTAQLERTRREALAFLRKLRGYAELNGFENGRKVPEPDTRVVDNHFRAHPAAWDRLDRLRPIPAPAPAPAVTPPASNPSR
jgi:predicted Zn-dependent protease